MRTLTDLGLLLLAVGAVCIIVDVLVPMMIRRLG